MRATRPRSTIRASRSAKSIATNAAATLLAAFLANGTAAGTEPEGDGDDERASGGANVAGEDDAKAREDCRTHLEKAATRLRVDGCEHIDLDLVAGPGTRIRVISSGSGNSVRIVQGSPPAPDSAAEGAHDTDEDADHEAPGTGGSRVEIRTREAIELRE